MVSQFEKENGYIQRYIDTLLFRVKYYQVQQARAWKKVEEARTKNQYKIMAEHQELHRQAFENVLSCRDVANEFNLFLKSRKAHAR